ncbi:MAG: carboxylesterase family protein, partial [Sphaerochaetaceae bacterium]|nr:carboxylesterase family protein [Sphaerochaetaceae bacterium]
LPPSSDVFEAFYPGASPVQIKSEQNIMRFHRQSEDCLYLNIRKSVSADRHQKPRKVIVYVFGGDGSYGSSVNPIINGFNLIKKNPDLIFVNFNYRFGMLGFADFSGIPGGENYPDANHLGLLDIISALRWVKCNIAAFGGDPDSITLAADTAGSSYVLALSLIEQSKNLFSKVILFSTAIYAGFTDKASLIDVTGKEIEELGVNTMEELVNLPQEKIAGTYEKYAFFNAPVLDGKFVPENIFEAFRQKKYGNIEFVFGFAESELSAWSALVSSEVACLFSTNAYNQIYRNAVSDAERNIMKSFVESRMKEGKTEQMAKTLFAELLLYRYHTLCLCNILSDNGSKVRCFLWKAKSPGDVFNANIVSALTTIMGNSEVAEAFGFVIDESLSALLQSLLKKFICNEAVETFRNEIKGMPAVEWPGYKGSSPEVLVVSDSGFSITRDMGIQELNGFSI